MVSYIASRIILLVFGTLYPAYSSYKAIKMKNVREYVRWMMYWIVYALFISAEMIADMLLGFWFPFYYELKIIFLIWLLSPSTKGSSFLYRKFVHPWLAKHEKDIDSYIEQAKENGYDTFVRVSRNGLAVAAETMMKTAVTGQSVIAEKLRQYGTEGTDAPPTDRLHKSKSWSSGMNVTDNDCETIHEAEEERKDVIVLDEPTDSDAESAKLQGELDDHGEKGLSSSRIRKPQSSYSSATLPRSFGRNKSQSTRNLYTPGYEPFGSGMSSSYSASSSSLYPGTSYSKDGFQNPRAGQRNRAYEAGATTRSRSRRKIV